MVMSCSLSFLLGAALLMNSTFAAPLSSVVQEPCSATMPAPFSTPLQMGNNSIEVMILHQLLARTPPGRATGGFNVSGTVFDEATYVALLAFQRASHGKAKATGVLDRVTALLLLSDRYSDDGYRDDGRSAADHGMQYKYKILIPVHRNRSIQTNATFMDAHNNILFHFPVRTKGHVHDGCGRSLPESWPNFNDTGYGLNQFSSGGMTPTGLIEIDLNSPEGEPKLYGPYPVTRFVHGLAGNAAFLVPDVRNGILIHTGEWPGWKDGDNMPNSAGCVHTWPEFVKTIWKTAVRLGAETRKNPFGKRPYPFRPQALASVFLV